MIKEILKMKDEEAKAEQWAEMLPLITRETAVRKDETYGEWLLTWAIYAEAPLEVLSRLLKAWPDAAQVKDKSGEKLPLHSVCQGTPFAFFTELLAAYPQGAQEKDMYERVPLHHVADNQASFEVISALIAAYPEGATTKDRWGNQAVDLDFPLHHACRFAAPTEQILGLLQAQPELAAAKDKQDLVPLHHAAANKGTSLQVIEALLTAYPQGAQEKDHNKQVPLHLAARNKDASLPAIEALLAAFAAGVKAQDKNGQVPMLLALRTNAPLEVLSRLLAACSDAAQVKDEEGSLPLHFVRQNTPLAFVVELLAVYPQGAQEKNEKGQVPLHLAADNKASFEVISALIAAYPEGATIKDNQGNQAVDIDFPLHHACRFAAPTEHILGLLQTQPELAAAKDKQGQVPLHLALTNKATSLQVIEALLAAFADGVKAQDEKGRMPVHVALTSQAPLKVFLRLLAIWPDAAQVKDSDGKLPLHYAASCEKPLAFITEALAVYPQGAQEKDKQGQVPLHLAVNNEARSLPLIDTLLSAFADGIKTQDEKGRVPLHVAVTLYDKAPLEVLSRLLTAWPDAAQVKDSDGKLPLHYTYGTTPFAFITELLAAYPKGAQEKDDRDKVPLHLAADNKASFEVISALIAAYPEGATIKNRNGNRVVDIDFPLHHACQFAAPTEHILGLLQAQPELAAAKDKWGQVPLHLAVTRCTTSLQVIEALMAAFTDGVKTQDEKDRMPVHVALKNDAPFEVLSRLLAAWPDAAQVKGLNDYPMYEGIALHLAVLNNAPLAFLKELFAVYPQGVQEKDKNGHVPLHFAINKMAFSEDLPLFLLLLDLPLLPVDENSGTCTPQKHAGSWTLIMDHPKLKVKQVLFLVKSVFDKLPSFAAHQQLAHCKDAKGREAISICHADVRAFMRAYLLFLGKFELQQGPPVHKSATAVVMLANNHSVSSEYLAAYKKQPISSSSSFTLAAFGAALASLGLHSESTKDEAHLEQAFEFANASKSGSMSEDEFVAFCVSTFGSSRRCVLKFMANEDQWKREIDVRNAGGLDSRFVVGLLGEHGPSNERYSSSIASVTLYDGNSLSAYRYCIVMPAADRSLDEIYKKERPEMPVVRIITKKLALSVQHCHDQGILHGDLKMLNALRVDGSIKLIDMDASALLERDYAGAKFSSGILPPEFFFEFVTSEQEEQYLRYWSKEREANGELWQTKLKPVSFKQGAKKPRTLVVKTFRVSSAAVVAQCQSGEVPELGCLPYTPVLAATSLDMWSLGLVLFTLCTGKPLVGVNRDDDLDSPEAFLKAASWTDAALDAYIHQSTTTCPPAAVDLLMRLLRVKPEDRLQSMADVLALHHGHLGRQRGVAQHGLEARRSERAHQGHFGQDD